MAHVMIMPLKAGEDQSQEARPLPLGLHNLHTYTCLKNGSGRVSLVVMNMSDSHIFLKKGVLVAHVMSASPVPPYRVVAGDGSCSWLGSQTRTHVSRGESGEAA